MTSLVTPTTTPASPATASTALDENTRQAVLQAEAHVQQCLVCYSDLTTTTLTPCQHDEICPTCHLRLRHLHKDLKCPICKTANEQLIVDQHDVHATTNKTFDDYPVWGNDLGSDYVYRQDVGMFFPIAYYHTTIQPLFGYHCTEPGCPYNGMQQQDEEDSNTNTTAVGTAANSQKPKNAKRVTPIRGLQDHLRVKHRKALCQLCIDHQRDFVAQLPRFSPTALKEHLQRGDGSLTGFDGHPVCEFCKPKRFYDLTALHSHLNKDHYKCHVCEKQGLPNQFFRNYPALAKHFERMHFLCNDAQCLAARFVVFDNELDLRHHERQVHGGTSLGNAKIQLEFRVRRPVQGDPNQSVPGDEDFNYGLDGEAFVPAALSRDANGAAPTLHPLHVERTAQLRQQAAALRQDLEQEGVVPESFPSLQASQAEAMAADANGSNGNNTPMRLGWASGATLNRLGRRDAGAVTEEAFPALPAAAAKKSAVAKLRGPAARGTAAASTPASGGNWKKSGSSSLASAVAPYASAPRSSHASSQQQQQARLGADQFPSLGGPAKPQATKYTAANALAKRNLQQQPQSAPPSWSNGDFPSIAPAAPSASASLRARVVHDHVRGPSVAAQTNVLQATHLWPTVSVTVQDMKTALGSIKYKQLKSYTKEFASGNLEPQSYVDQAATLFDQGYGDADFWNFLPALIDSCPNDAFSQQAMQYLSHLRKMRNGALNAEANHQQQRQKQQQLKQQASNNSNWKAAPNVTAEPVPAPASAGWASAASKVGQAPPVVRQSVPAGMRYVPPPTNTSSSLRTVPGKTKNAWGGAGGASTVVRQANGSKVAAAAAAAGPQTGTATKFMAKELKAAKQQQSSAAASAASNGSKIKKKNKQKNELRQLAFGA